MAVENIAVSSHPASRNVIHSPTLGLSPVEKDEKESGYVPDLEESSLSSKEEISRSLEVAEQVAQAFDRQLRFRFRDETDGFQVEVLEFNGSEEKIIRKIPPDSVINFIEHVQEMFGALIDVEA